MKGNRAVLTAIVIFVVIGLGWWLFHRRGSVRVDLVSQFDSAEKRPVNGAFAVRDTALGNESMKAVAVPSNSRVTWRVRVPDDGWLRVSLGLDPQSWDKDGNGVYFYVGASDGRQFEELFNQHLDPHQNPGERRWIPVMVDLSAYSGEELQLIFNTMSSPPKTPADTRNDMPLWGAPEVVTR